MRLTNIIKTQFVSDNVNAFALGEYSGVEVKDPYVVTSTFTTGSIPKTVSIYALKKTVDAETLLTLTTLPHKGQNIIVLDAKGNASTYNINITGSGKNIQGAADTVSITTDYGLKELFYDGTQWLTLRG